MPPGTMLQSIELAFDKRLRFAVNGMSPDGIACGLVAAIASLCFICLVRGRYTKR